MLCSIRCVPTVWSGAKRRLLATANRLQHVGDSVHRVVSAHGQSDLSIYGRVYMWSTTLADVAQWIAAAFNRSLTLEPDTADPHAFNNKFSERRP